MTGLLLSLAALLWVLCGCIAVRGLRNEGSLTGSKHDVIYTALAAFLFGWLFCAMALAERATDRLYEMLRSPQ
jgi:hypothetical protein